MKRVISIVVGSVLVVGISVQVWAGGPRLALRSGNPVVSVGPGSVVWRGWGNGVYAIPAPYPYYYYYPFGYQYPPVIVVSPYPYYSYYLPPTIVANAPFFCVLHRVGFVSRVGMLDHLSGTHKIPLETAASVCPDGAEYCIFPAY